MKYTLTVAVLLAAVSPSAAQTTNDSSPPHPTMGSAMANGKRTNDGRPTDRFEKRNRGETLPELIEACWVAKEPGNNRNTDLDQTTAAFHAEVRTRWCATSLDAHGTLRRKNNRDMFASLDYLTLRFRSDTQIVEIRERSGVADKVIVNGRVVADRWWRSAIRSRVLELAKLPLL